MLRGYDSILLSRKKLVSRVNGLQALLSQAKKLTIQGTERKSMWKIIVQIKVKI